MNDVCDPPCQPRPMMGRSWWKNLGYNSPCSCAQYYAEKGLKHANFHAGTGEFVCHD